MLGHQLAGGILDVDKKCVICAGLLQCLPAKQHLQICAAANFEWPSSIQQLQFGAKLRQRRLRRAGHKLHRLQRNADGARALQVRVASNVRRKFSGERRAAQAAQVTH